MQRGPRAQGSARNVGLPQARNFIDRFPRWPQREPRRDGLCAWQVGCTACQVEALQSLLKLRGRAAFASQRALIAFCWYFQSLPEGSGETAWVEAWNSPLWPTIAATTVEDDRTADNHSKSGCE